MRYGTYGNLISGFTMLVQQKCKHYIEASCGREPSDSFRLLPSVLRVPDQFNHDAGVLLID
jgi:hypothetical protein